MSTSATATGFGGVSVLTNISSITDITSGTLTQSAVFNSANSGLKLAIGGTVYWYATPTLLNLTNDNVYINPKSVALSGTSYPIMYANEGNLDSNNNNIGPYSFVVTFSSAVNISGLINYIVNDGTHDPTSISVYSIPANIYDSTNTSTLLNSTTANSILQWASTATTNNQSLNYGTLNGGNGVSYYTIPLASSLQSCNQILVQINKSTDWQLWFAGLDFIGTTTSTTTTSTSTSTSTSNTTTTSSSSSGSSFNINSPAGYAAIAGIVVVLGVIIFALTHKRKKQEELNAPDAPPSGMPPYM